MKSAYALIKNDDHRDFELCTRILDEIRAIKDVTSAVAITGNFDIKVEFSATETADIERVFQAIKNISGVTSVEAGEVIENM